MDILKTLIKIVVFFAVILLIGFLLALIALKFIFYSCVIAFKNLFEEKIIRVENGSLYTPIDYYVHPKTKREVVVVGVIHIGEQSYYNYLQSLLDGLHNYKFTVLYEMIQKLNEEEQARLSVSERQALEVTRHANREMRNIIDAIPLVHQVTALTYDDRWINADIRMIDFISKFAAHKISITELFGKVSKKKKKEEKKKDYRLEASVLSLALKHLNLLFFFSQVMRYFSKKARIQEAIILGYRNGVACKYIDQYLSKGNIVTIWGAAHVPEINEFVRKKGFKRTKREWKCAIQGATLQNATRYLSDTLKKEWKELETAK